MEKNGQYVGVDEKYIPEDEKQANSNLNNEIRNDMNNIYNGAKKYVSNANNQKKTKRIFKGLAISYIVYIGIILIIFVAIFIFVFSIFFKANKQADESSKKFNEVWDKTNNIINDGHNKMDADEFNFDIENYSGTNDGSDVVDLLDDVIKTVKKNTNHKINVTYGTTTTSKSDEITALKKLFNEDNQYEVSTDYDSKGYINKITITDY